MLILVFVLCLLTFRVAQEKDKWQRIYTYGDAIIQMNISRITFGTGTIGRVRFRTVYSKSQISRASSKVKYKTRLETIEFKCNANQYRLFQSSLLDSQGKAVQSYEQELPDEWRQVRSGSMMERLFGPACKLIDLKRRNP
jgi:surface-adhesin protein E